jgi:type II secretory pathway pseudopilin PulG
MLGILLLILATTAVIFITAMLVPTISNRQSRETVLKGKSLRLAITAYQASHGGSAGAYPGNLSALVINDNNPKDCTPDNSTASATYMTLQGWCGPYLDQRIVENAEDYRTDGWATQFQYNPSTGAISSCGPNRTCGDADDLTF